MQRAMPRRQRLNANAVQDRRSRRRVPGSGKARRGGGHYRVASGCTPAPYAPDHGRNFRREKLYDHLSSAVYDDRAGGYFGDQARRKQQITAQLKTVFSSGFLQSHYSSLFLANDFLVVGMPSFLSVMVLSALLFTGLFLSQTNAEPMPNANGSVKQQIRIKTEKGYAEAQNNSGDVC